MPPNFGWQDRPYIFMANVIVQKKITSDAEPRNICLNVNVSNEEPSNPEGKINNASAIPTTTIRTLVFMYSLFP